jgi:hypothetical protein
VVFTVAASVPGTSAKESWHRLHEGQAVEGIVVMHIDATGGTVTFDNHDVIQQLPLAAP